jgi:hypothetical protein
MILVCSVCNKIILGLHFCTRLFLSFSSEVVFVLTKKKRGKFFNCHFCLDSHWSYNKWSKTSKVWPTVYSRYSLSSRHFLCVNIKYSITHYLVFWTQNSEVYPIQHIPLFLHDQTVISHNNMCISYFHGTLQCTLYIT